MDFALTAEQQQLYSSIARFARDVVRPGSGPRDREGRFDRVVWDACGQVGLTGICISQEYGGGGAGCLDTGLALEALAHGGNDAGLGLSLGAHLVIGSKPIDLQGTPEQ
ncbi:MAG TPA: acyl-CoA dehydrogenase family protein, partial [Euzebya sp.]|nr:acyl-CoA dehydrogenase family protein [Euzebya sp.]